MRFLFFIAFLSIGITVHAQRRIAGTVTDANQKPVNGASVFLSNTSVGTVTNNSGHFELAVPAGKYDLVISSIGYETQSRSVSGAAGEPELNIALKEKSKELDNVTVQSFEKDGWKKWGDFFLRNFIGSQPEAQRCRIKNAGMLRFRHDKNANVLYVLAREPILIENKALGYRIRYQLEDFHYDFQSGLLQYTGYPLFEELEAGTGRARRWAKAREDAYYGSLLHFMRSVFTNKLAANGFEVYHLRKIPRQEWVEHVDALPGGGSVYHLRNGQVLRCDAPADSIRYYQAYVGKEPLLNLSGGRALPGDSIAWARDSATAVLEFGDYLTVLYSKGKTPEEYQRTVANRNYAMQSEITLLSGRTVDIEASGAYFDPTDLLFNGWWGWSEKIARQLPFDYKPKE